jgi:capsular polysaccharide biosynthesis protein
VGTKGVSAARGRQRNIGTNARSAPVSSLAPLTLPGRSLPDWLLITFTCTAIVLAAVASALAVVSTADKVYGARSDVLYVSAPASPLDVRDRALATQRQLIESRAVLGPVAAQSRMPLEDLQKRVSVELGTRNDLMHITVGNRRPRTAQRLAQAVTAQYLALSRRLSSEANAERSALQRELQTLTARASRASAAQRAVIGERVARLQDRVIEFDAAALGNSKPTLVAPAYVLPKPLSPQPLRAVAAALIVGLALATAVAILLARQLKRWPAR